MYISDLKKFEKVNSDQKAISIMDDVLKNLNIW